MPSAGIGQVPWQQGKRPKENIFSPAPKTKEAILKRDKGRGRKKGERKENEEKRRGKKKFNQGQKERVEGKKGKEWLKIKNKMN
jgi:hypothetical protein